MSTLFLDTSYNQILGLLDDKGAWIDKSILTGQKSSSVLHSELHQLCLRNKIAPKEVTKVLYVAGPGFYTGLRIAYGLADMLKLEEKQVQGFYTFDIPSLLGEQDYLWITKAYRGEVFLHRYENGLKASQLISDKEFLSQHWSEKVFIHSPTALDPLMSEKIPTAISTEELMLNRMPELFESLKKNSESNELFYFRPPEEEFKPSL